MGKVISALSVGSVSKVIFVVLVVSIHHGVDGWLLPQSTIRSVKQTKRFLVGGPGKESNGSESVDIEYLKSELAAYLQKRQEVGADEQAKKDVGKTVGGTRGNVLLDYVSLAPNKGGVVEVPANAFDYSELEKYGYSYLSTPIMEAGGRLAMYDLMGLEKPALKRPKKANTSAPSIIIDRTGETDKARYSGLKLGQILDDDMQANALVEAERKAKQGESLRPKLIEEEYERPFADVRNTGPKEQPYWTAERLDEWGKQKGKSLAEAKRLREEALVADRMESLDLELPQRLFSILTGLLIATAFGKSTPTFLSKTLNIVSDDQQLSSLLDLIKVPALALLLACVGSSVLCGMQASGKKRNSIVWTVKGLLGGPLSVTQLRGLPTLVTRREMESQERTD